MGRVTKNGDKFPTLDALDARQYSKYEATRPPPLIEPREC